MDVLHSRLQPEVDEPSVHSELFGEPAVERLRVKPDAILLQTDGDGDGHRKPPPPRSGAAAAAELLLLLQPLLLLHA